MVNYGVINAEDILLLGMGLASVLDGQLTLGSYMTFRSHLALLDQGPKELFSLWNDILTIRMSSSVYFELLYRESQIPCSLSDSCGQRLTENSTDVGLTLALENVSFAYKLNPHLKVLDDVTIQLKPGKIVALCGGSGGGKTIAPCRTECYSQLWWQTAPALVQHSQSDFSSNLHSIVSYPPHLISQVKQQLQG